MMATRFKPLWLAILLTASLPFQKTEAQTQGPLGHRFLSNWSVGIGGGPNIFFGDLKVYDFWPVSRYDNEWRFAGTFTLSRQLSHVFSLRGQLLYGGIAGTKRLYSDGTPCYQSFKGNIFEYNINATINFVNLFFPYNPDWRFFVYGTIGVGFSNWYTTVYNMNSRAELRRSGKPGNWTTEIVIPAGLGAYYNLGDKVNLGIEWTLRGVNSDKLDATPGGFRYDLYSLFSVNVTYNFNRRTKPAEMKPLAVPDLQPVMLPGDQSKPTDTSAITDLKTTPLLYADSAAYGLSKDQELRTGVDSLFLPDETGDMTALSAGESGPDVPGISYRVQVFAFRTNDYTANDIRAKYHLKQPIYKEYSDGWYRYTLGSYRTLKAARSAMYHIRSVYRIYDAFVARYKDGLRYPSDTGK